jgi:hypothetical protein
MSNAFDEPSGKKCPVVSLKWTGVPTRLYHLTLAAAARKGDVTDQVNFTTNRV